MDKNYFSKDLLSKKTIEELESVAIDAGTSFLSGKVTSTVFKATTTDIGKTATTVGTAGLGAYEVGRGLYDDFSQNGEEIITTLSQVLISKATEVLTKEVAKATTDYMIKHAQEITKFPQNVASYAMDYFNANKISVSDVLKTLKEAGEKRLEEQNIKDEKKSLEDAKNKKQKDAKKLLDDVNKYVTKATSYISMVTSYIQNGPDWVVDQLDKQIESVVNQVKKNLDKQWAEKDLPEYRERARNIGETQGKRLVNKYNKALSETQKRALEKIEQSKSKAMTKLLSVKAKAASLIASKTGIYIPI